MEFCNSEGDKNDEWVFLQGVFACPRMVCVPKHLPSRFGHLSEVREVFLDPRVDLLQCHLPVLVAVDGKLNQGHVGVRWLP